MSLSAKVTITLFFILLAALILFDLFKILVLSSPNSDMPANFGCDQVLISFLLLLLYLEIAYMCMYLLILYLLKGYNDTPARIKAFFCLIVIELAKPVAIKVLTFSYSTDKHSCGPQVIAYGTVSYYADILVSLVGLLAIVLVIFN
jgi:hypothetical protein